MELPYSSSMGFDDLEIRIFKASRTAFSVELRLPDGSRWSGRMSAEGLRALEKAEKPQEYGEQLFRWVFQEEVARAFTSASRLAQAPTRLVSPDLGIRLRLWLDPEAGDLQRLNWECLWQPESDPVSTRTAFSRFLRVPAPQVWSAATASLKMLLVVANPEGKPTDDIDQISIGLQKMVSSGADQFMGNLDLKVAENGPTLNLLEDAAKENYRMVHLIAHSVWQGNQRALVLTGKDGRAQLVPFPQAAESMMGLAKNLPSLIFISAPLAPQERKIALEDFLAPALVNAGAQAVITVEAAMDLRLLTVFTQEFYRVLSWTGVVDEAAARARQKIFSSEQWDWTIPVLYTRAQENIQVFQQVSQQAMSLISGITKGD